MTAAAAFITAEPVEVVRAFWLVTGLYARTVGNGPRDSKRRRAARAAYRMAVREHAYLTPGTSPLPREKWL